MELLVTLQEVSDSLVGMDEILGKYGTRLGSAIPAVLTSHCQSSGKDSRDVMFLSPEMLATLTWEHR